MEVLQAWPNKDQIHLHHFDLSMKAKLGTEESDRCREMGGPFGKTGELYDNFFLSGVYHFRFLENILSTHITLMTRNKKTDF